MASIDTVVYVDRLPVYSDQCCQKPPCSRYVSSIKMGEKNENFFLAGNVWCNNVRVNML